jgi:hypothetical protein
LTRDSPEERGVNYLLARIRAGELASRAPDDSPFKDWDETGEAYLALDAVIAAEPRLTLADRELLAGRLMAKQRQGTWDYRGGQRPDVDTSASALRALDRLGTPVGLHGLRRFYNPRTQLFDTFGHRADRQGLSLPPQTREKHFAAHPCVLPNVWLLLLERRKLGGLAPHRLAPMQREDGGWHSYYYPSPYYATRLFAELLTQLGPEHDAALERTAAHLLQASASTPTCDAEVLIALSCLARRFSGLENNLRAKAATILERVRAAQLPDGSWPGDVIFTHLHRTEPGSVIALDHLRVRSTSLCVRALRLWQ